MKYGLEIIQTGTIRKLGRGFLFNGSILHHIRDKSRCRSKIVIFISVLH